MSGLFRTTLISTVIALTATSSVITKSAEANNEPKNFLCHFLPDNDLYIAADQKMNYTTMTEADFNRIIDTVDKVYKPIVKQYGGNLTFKRSWTDGTVNAQAYQQGSTWWVEMFGGLARHQAITADALALVACHEIGHHIGGAPKYTTQGASGAWAGVEGQADYFATLKCLRKVFASDGGSVGQVDASVQADCDKYHGAGSADSLICQRIIMAGISSGNMFGSMDGHYPSITARDLSRVTKTNEDHPATQCRVDTYHQAALCEVSDTVNVDQRDANIGVCINGSAQDYGSRPLCWYKPSGVVPSPTPTPGPNPTPVPQPTPTPLPGQLAVAPTPLLNGGTSLQTSNPQASINVTYDVSAFTSAYGVFFEVSRPNMAPPPNGIAQDRNAWRVFSQVGTKGQFSFVPQTSLPGWGTYQIRLIPLDRTGRIPQGQFSNPAVLQVTPQLRVR